MKFLCFISRIFFVYIYGAFFQRRSAANKTKKKQTQKKYIYWKPFSVFFVDIDPTKSGCVLR